MHTCAEEFLQAGGCFGSSPLHHFCGHNYYDTDVYEECVGKTGSDTLTLTSFRPQYVAQSVSVRNTCHEGKVRKPSLVALKHLYARSITEIMCGRALQVHV